jgi:serine/threonine kinase PknH
VDTTLYEFDPLEPGDPQAVGGYPLRARIGAGGMGRVYLSFTPGGRPVAVKLIRSELASDPEFRERFAREVSIAQQVNGIHIAQLIDSGSDRGVPWLASAYVAGPSLAQVVSACGPLPPATLLGLAGRIAESLAAIHATGMVHRDLKPGNILLDESGPKVIDFGIVRAATPTATGLSSHRTFIGSPPFMAPEQIRGRKVTAATDVFALGATVYYLATGESAFQADFADGVLYRVLHDEPDYEECPEQVRELIRACLRKEPEERPSTQRIIEGCRAAGAGPATPLPDEVRAMIQSRVQALAMLVSRPVEPRAPVEVPIPAISTGSAGSTVPIQEDEETEQETATDPAHAGSSGGQPAPTPVAAAATAMAAAAQPDDPHAAPTVTGAYATPNAPRQGGTATADLAPTPVPLLAPTVPVPLGTTEHKSGSTAIAPPARKRRGRTLLVAVSSSLVTAVVAVVVAALLWPSSSKTDIAGPGPTGSPSLATGTANVTQPAAASDGASATSATSSDSPNSSTAGASTGTGTSDGLNVAESSSTPIQWQGRVMITSTGTDLDSVPVNNGASNIQQSSLYNSSSLTSTPTLTSLPSSGTIAPWTGSGTPTRGQCYSQVLSQGVGQVSVSDGTLLCVITPQDRVALLEVVDDQADNDEGILTDAVVWSQISSASPDD